jgi:hypothetical protein
MADNEDREYQLVVTPLIDWLDRQKLGWIFHHPKHPTSARGWDIEAWREGEYLLIEAKYIAASSISSFSGLVSAPLAARARHWNDPGWCCCWAVGIKPQVEHRGRHVYQIFFDYMARNAEFWKHYGEDLRMRYIFFVQESGVTMIPFTDFLEMTNLYSGRVIGKVPLKECRRIAEELLSAYLEKAISN